MYIGVTGPGTSGCEFPPVCLTYTATVGVTFQLVVVATAIPENGYNGFDVFLQRVCTSHTDPCYREDPSTLRYLPRASCADEVVWPDAGECDHAAHDFPVLTVGAVTAYADVPPLSSFTGRLLELDLQCTDDEGYEIQFDAALYYDQTLRSVDAKVLNTSDGLFIYCYDPTRTPTPTRTLSPSVTPQPTRTNTPTPTPWPGQGDVNCDEVTNAVDAALMLQYSAGLLSSFPCEIAYKADINGDGRVNAIDAALVLQFAAGLVSWDCLDGYC